MRYKTFSRAHEINSALLSPSPAAPFASSSVFPASGRFTTLISISPLSSLSLSLHFLPSFDLSNLSTSSISFSSFTLMRSDSRQGGIGIAAPQVGVSEQVVVIDMPEYGDIQAIPNLVMFNPIMEFLLDHEVPSSVITHKHVV